MGKGIPSAKKVAESLRMNGQHSHSNTSANMSIPDADVKLSIIDSLNKQLAHLEKVKKLRLNGWNGTTCIDCHKKIPPARLKAMPECCRCVSCQSNLELQNPPKLRGRR